MYELGPAFQHRTVHPGKNILVAGPPLSGTRTVAFTSLTHGLTRGEGALIITTRYSADQILEELGSQTDGQLGTQLEGRLGIVDSVSRQQGGSLASDPHIKYAASPADLTGIGTAFSTLLDTLTDTSSGRIRLVVDSLSTLVPYVGVEPTCQFATVLSEQVTALDGVGLYIVEPTAHDPETRSTIEQLFEARVGIESGRIVESTLSGPDEERL